MTNELNKQTKISEALPLMRPGPVIIMSTAVSDHTAMTNSLRRYTMYISVIIHSSTAECLWSWCDGLSDCQPCNKGQCMYYPVCGMVHIKDHLLLIEKGNPWSGSSKFHLLLSEWSFTIYPMLCNHKLKVLSVLFNKTLPSFLHFCSVKLVFLYFNNDESEINITVLIKSPFTFWTYLNI